MLGGNFRDKGNFELGGTRRDTGELMVGRTEETEKHPLPIFHKAMQRPAAAHLQWCKCGRVLPPFPQTSLVLPLWKILPAHTHLVRLTVRLGLWGDGWISSLVWLWLVHSGRP